jgi:hypothetical protein
MKNQAYKQVFLTLGGAAAGANVASIAAGIAMTTVPALVPIAGALILGGIGFYTARHDGPLIDLRHKSIVADSD